MVASNMSLRWLTYITRVLLKSCKMIPVLFGGVILRKKKYSWTKYLSVLVVTSGIVMFMYFNPHSTSTTKEKSIIWPGLLLASLSLVFDGFTGAAQDFCVIHYGTSVGDFLFYINFYGMLIMLAISLVFGEFFAAIKFIYLHPEISNHLIGFCFTGVFGQILLYTILRQTSALVVATITTTRKLFTVILSVIVFGHQLLSLQWLAIGIVFGGFFFDTFTRKRSEKVKKAQFLDSVALDDQASKVPSV
ncbi:hypothetical protein GEMRC1_010878 [Eukaryota sp. GEM-RC1]